MQNIGTSASSLAERVRVKAEQERQEMESLTRQQFSALSESLRQSSQNALSTTEAAILAQLGKLRETVSPLVHRVLIDVYSPCLSRDY